MTNKKSEFWENVLHYIYTILEIAVMAIGVVIAALLVVFGPIALAFGPMYVSPWWGFVSIPGTIFLGSVVLAWRETRNGR